MGSIVFRAGEQDGHDKNIYTSYSVDEGTHNVDFVNFNWGNSQFMYFFLQKDIFDYLA